MFPSLYSTSRHYAFSQMVIFILCCLMGSIFCMPHAHAQLNGTYTIGGADGTYASFSQAVAALQAEGISGSVAFKIRPGLYEEQVLLKGIPGSSCEQPIVFEGETGDSTDVVLQTSGYAVIVDGVDGVTFRRLTIDQINIRGGSDCFTLENNLIQGIFLAESGPGALASHRHRYRNNAANTIRKIKTGAFNPANPDFDKDLQITGNHLFGEGIQLSGQEGIIVNDNTIELLDVYGAFTEEVAIGLTNCWYGKEIRRNTIHITSYFGWVVGIKAESGIPERVSENRIRLEPAQTIERPHNEPLVGLGGGTGILLSTGKTQSGEVLIANNDIFVDGYDRAGQVHSLAGIVIRQTAPAERIKVYHNTVETIGYKEYPESSAFFAGPVADNSLFLRNNIFINLSYGYTLTIQKPSSLAVSDYNFLGNPIGWDFKLYWDGQEVEGLDAWQELTGMDLHSITSGTVAGKGIAVPEVDIDINGKRRPNPPSIGAVELGTVPEGPLPVIPIKECVTRNADGTYTASFGYLNPNSTPVTIPLGTANSFNVMPNAGQPFTFAPGRRTGVFYVVFDGSPLTWTLGSATVSVDRTEKSCPVPIQQVEPIVECVTSSGNALYIASLGFHNPNNRSVAIAMGGNNTFNTGENLGQPTLFPANHRAVGAFYVVFSGSELVWKLGSRTAVANRFVKSCPIPISAITPLLECVQDNGEGTFTAYFGYHNPNNRSIAAPIGEKNRFDGGQANQGQPVVFQPGLQEKVFSVDFDGTTLEWSLLNQSVTASDDPALSCQNEALAQARVSQENRADSGSSVYPNPFQDHVMIRFAGEKAERSTVRVYAITGVLVAAKEVGLPAGGSVELALPHLKPGVYLVEIRTGSVIQRVKLVKE